MKTSPKRSLVVSLIMMIAPFGAFAEDEAAALYDRAQLEAAVVEAETKAQALVDEAKANTQLEAEAAEAKVGLSEANAAILADSRQKKAWFVRAERAKNRRGWVKFAFDPGPRSEFVREFVLDRSTPAERAENRRQWWSFAFCE